MNKVVKSISRILFSLLLIVSIFGTINVLAEEVIFKITNISVKEKSDKVTVNDVSLSGGSIKNDIIFTEKDDYIKYDITIKNSTTDNYTIKSISDDNTSQYLEYTYDDLSNVKLNAGEEKKFELQIKYVQETNNLTISDQSISLTLTYEKDDGTTGTETITNPKTRDNITTYIIIGIISLVGLAITTVSKKHLSKSLMAIVLLSSVILPLGVKADINKFIISFDINKFQNSYSKLIKGPDFIIKIAELSGYNIEYNEAENDFWNIEEDDYYYNDKINSIKRATLQDFNNIKNTLTDSNIVSTSDSNVPTYLWLDETSGIMYYYSNAKKIFLNEDSSYMFYYLESLNSIDLKTFDTSNVTNMSSMFCGNKSMLEYDLSGFDTSVVTNMEYMFYGNESLSRLNLSNFDTKNVNKMTYMISSCNNLIEVNLSNFDTKNVTSMSGMFSNDKNIEILDLSMFDTSKVESFSQMFMRTEKLKTIYVSNLFTVTGATGLNPFSGMFTGDNALTGGAGTTFDNSNSSNGDYACIDDPDNGKPGYFTNIADKPQS